MTRAGRHDDPLALMHDDHLREREVLALIDAIAAAETPDPADAAEALAFLRGALPLHLEDEEADLFPLLRARCAPEDDIDRAIGRLADDHRRAAADTRATVAILEAVAASAADLSAEDRETLAAYAGRARRHLFLENAIVLPFAKLRLTAADRRSLRNRMRRRRGLDHDRETPDA